MPRTRPTFVTRADTRPEGIGELGRLINDLLSVANWYLQDPEASPFARVVHRALLAISADRGGTIHHWPEWAYLAFTNIRSLVQDGRTAYLRQCAECQRWFLVFDARRQVCHRIPCRRRAACKRAVASQKIEREKQQRARGTV